MTSESGYGENFVGLDMATANMSNSGTMTPKYIILADAVTAQELKVPNSDMKVSVVSKRFAEALRSPLHKNQKVRIIYPFTDKAALKEEDIKDIWLKMVNARLGFSYPLHGYELKLISKAFGSKNILARGLELPKSYIKQLIKSEDSVRVPTYIDAEIRCLHALLVNNRKYDYCEYYKSVFNAREDESDEGDNNPVYFFTYTISRVAGNYGTTQESKFEVTVS